LRGSTPLQPRPCSSQRPKGKPSPDERIGLAIGVAVLIAILGSPHSPLATIDVYRRAWVVVAAISLAGGVAGAWLLARRRQPVTAPTDAPTPAVVTSPAGEGR
jgi:hypothetical protein